MKLNHKSIITNIKSKFQSIRIRLFTTLCASVAVIIVFLILINNVVLETYYIYSKQTVLLGAYKAINAYYNGNAGSSNIELELEKLSFSNDFDILIKTDTSIYSSSKNFLSTLVEDEYTKKRGVDESILYDKGNVQIKRTIDNQTELSFILLSAELDNGYELYIRVAVASIQASARIANKLLMLIGIVTIIISGLVLLVISRKFTSPIEELNKITSKISELDFSYKYDVRDSEDEMNNLRKKYKYNVRNFGKDNKTA